MRPVSGNESAIGCEIAPCDRSSDTPHPTPPHIGILGAVPPSAAAAAEAAESVAVGGGAVGSADFGVALPSLTSIDTPPLAAPLPAEVGVVTDAGAGVGGGGGRVRVTKSSRDGIASNEFDLVMDCDDLDGDGGGGRAGRNGSCAIEATGAGAGAGAGVGAGAETGTETGTEACAGGRDGTAGGGGIFGSPDFCNSLNVADNSLSCFKMLVKAGLGSFISAAPKSFPSAPFALADELAAAGLRAGLLLGFELDASPAPRAAGFDLDDSVGCAVLVVVAGLGLGFCCLAAAAV